MWRRGLIVVLLFLLGCVDIEKARDAAGQPQQM
jgi:hypothetical protein